MKNVINISIENRENVILWLEEMIATAEKMLMLMENWPGMNIKRTVKGDGPK